MSLAYAAWVQQMRPHHLTIRDVLAMKPGDSIQLICFDRNLGGMVSGNERNKPMPPAKFFERAYAVRFVKRTELSGTWHWNFHVAGAVAREEAFDIEYVPGHWYPLTVDGRLPQPDPQWPADSVVPAGGVPGTHYATYPPETRIGWRGPMMLAALIRDGPPVHLPVE